MSFAKPGVAIRLKLDNVAAAHSPLGDLSLKLQQPLASPHSERGTNQSATTSTYLKISLLRPLRNDPANYHWILRSPTRPQLACIGSSEQSANGRLLNEPPSTFTLVSAELHSPGSYDTRTVSCGGGRLKLKIFGQPLRSTICKIDL